ncbi:hypothetical protein ASE95_05035 [Sphingomonas sp. Leaf231]|uniref:hypothetical protein n=1 Tax=Sphingomonas sp. Leaf231 TaxID=1736301 RepID=UPI0006F5E734|nr:hypothetical protein [Sphingomonas sp. Leaf231]KQN94220.1 hypothetical protein ASE95_05035 [Sphingomonas sp. Leaf231]
MAYLMLDDPRAVVTTAPQPAPLPVATMPCADPTPTRLTALEWSVVALARKDRLSSLRRPGRLAVALGIVFKPQHNPMLADERLEALRRMAVLGWHYGYTVPTTELSRFLDAGFSPAQYDLMMDSIGVAKLRTAHR